MAVCRAFDPSAYPEPLSRLVSGEGLCELGPGAPRLEVRSELQALSIEDLFTGRTIVDRKAAAACLSGLWLLHDFLDESHTISQSITTPTGSYWHGIMHRREPDYANAKYWFRRVGEHPVFDELGYVTAGFTVPDAQRREASSESKKGMQQDGSRIHQNSEWSTIAEFWRIRLRKCFTALPDAASEAARSLQMSTDWDPFAFVDLCQSVRAGRSELEPICREIARAEWELLFDYSYRKALG